MAAILRNDGTFGKSSIAVKPDVSGRAAEFVQAAVAVRTFAAGIDSIHRDAISRLQPADVWPDFLHHSRKFMTDYERNRSAGARMRSLSDIERAMQILIEIRMAERSALHTEADFVPP